ncbi:MAG: hypothetical protein ABH835_01240, partial [Patescibacteria group bacterium]
MPVAKTKRPSSLKEKKTCNMSSYAHLIIYIVIVLALALGGAKLYVLQKKVDATIDNNTYQAVFLTNGQVYFGELNTVNRDLLKLNNVYYLQVTEDLQQQAAEKEGAEQAAQAAAQPSFSLVKLGDELHQPVSEMVINREQILFWEN